MSNIKQSSFKDRLENDVSYKAFRTYLDRFQYLTREINIFGFKPKEVKAVESAFKGLVKAAARYEKASKKLHPLLRE